MPSQFVPVPVQGPLPVHCVSVASLMHFPLTGHPVSLVHQQHWNALPHCPWLISHVVWVGQALAVPVRLHVVPATEQPALSLNSPPVQSLAAAHLPLLQPPLLPRFVPLLLHWSSLVHRQ
jgi:hypothetical protein